MTNVVFFPDLQHLPKAFALFPIQRFTGKEVLIKLHMGEKGNSYFMKPTVAKSVVDELTKIHARPFLFDTTVAYHGSRFLKSQYQELAKRHGFTMKNVGCDVIIDDEGISTTVEGRTFEVATHLKKSTYIIALSHVKGHIQSGMGGAIKNFGMGGVTKETKTKIHNSSYPVYTKEACTFCGACANACPFTAINVNENSWEYNENRCFGCDACVDVCQSKALQSKDADFQFLLACSAKACVQNKTVLYLNEMKRISKGCDCDPNAGPIICSDVGYLLSDDPVAVDKASLDLIDKVQENVFFKVNKVNPYKQIQYGEKIGLGSASYELLEI